jgi:CRISPR-associated protein Csd2
MTTRKLVVFRHASALGNARAQALFDRVTVLRNHHGALHPPGAEALDNAGPPRKFTDYDVKIDRDRLPDGIELLELV